MDPRKEVAHALRDYLARERLSREQFAFRTRLGKSTVDKLMTGLFSDRTLAIVEAQTGLELRCRLGSAPPADAGPTQPHPPSAQPSKAVLPIAFLGDDPALAYIGEGLADDLITGLTRLRWLFTVARHSSFLYRDSAIDLRQVARELGVRYVLDGSVRLAGGRIRIAARLTDADSGQHLWAERYDGALDDVFAVQDDIAERVVAAVEPHLYVAEGHRASSRPATGIGSWGLVVRALALLTRMSRTQNEQAQELLRRAISVDPGYARAHAVLAWAQWWSAHCLWYPDSAERQAHAASLAREALSLDPGDPWARMVSGLCLSTAGEHSRALDELSAALALNPSSALVRMVHGWALLRAGEFDHAIVETGRALKLSPTDTFSGFYTSTHGLALLAARRFSEALPPLRISVAAFADYSGHFNQLISCCGHLGLLDEAHEAMARRATFDPPLRLSMVRSVLRPFAHMEVFVEGLAKAGVEK